MSVFFLCKLWLYARVYVSRTEAVLLECVSHLPRAQSVADIEWILDQLRSIETQHQMLWAHFRVKNPPRWFIRQMAQARAAIEESIRLTRLARWRKQTVVLNGDHA